jgi:hypothetical protein
VSLPPGDTGPRCEDQLRDVQSWVFAPFAPLLVGGGWGSLRPLPVDGMLWISGRGSSANRRTFEQAGFTYSRPKGKNHCVMSMTVTRSNIRAPG